MRRAAWMLAVALTLVGVGANRAEAHAAGNTPASNYVSRVTSTKPPTKTFSAQTIEAGARLEVQWRSGSELQIADYDGYPYLRVGPEGVFENRQSNAAYLNATRSGGGNIPDGLNPAGPPQWRQISAGHVARFHDHRAHYMGSEPPPQVRSARNRSHLVQRNDVEIVQGAVTHTVTVEVRWKPSSSPIPLLALAGLLGVTATVAVVAAVRQGRRAAALAGFTAMLLSLVVVDAIHLFGIAFGVRGGSGFGRAVSIGWPSILAWIAVAASVILLRSGKPDALYACVFSAGVITLVGGLSDLSVLSSSSVPFAFANIVARLAISFTLALGVAAIATGVILTGSPARGRASDDGLEADGV